jgi:hypothetical protein
MDCLPGELYLAVGYSTLFWRRFVELKNHVLRDGFSVDGFRIWQQQGVCRRSTDAGNEPSAYRRHSFTMTRPIALSSAPCIVGVFCGRFIEPSFRILGGMRRPSNIGVEGKIALSVIVLCALCFCDPLLNAVDYVRPSWVVCQTLSFPTGWIMNAVAEKLVASVVAEPDKVDAVFVFTSACAGTVLNIYMIAFGVTRCSALARTWWRKR